VELHQKVPPVGTLVVISTNENNDKLHQNTRKGPKGPREPSLKLAAAKDEYPNPDKPSAEQYTNDQKDQLRERHSR
jgi:hypothetical protein